MKIALLYSGKFRCFEKSKKTLDNILYLKPDVYAQFWNQDSFDTFFSYVEPVSAILTREPVVTPKQKIIERAAAGVRIENVFKMYLGWYIAKKAFAESLLKYDWVIRTRTDISYEKPLNLDN